MGRQSLPLVLIAIAFVAVALAACGGGQPQEPSAIDLAKTKPVLTLWSAQAKDRVGAVASGDFNGDGHRDIIVGSFNADGPDDSRPDSGEAYVIFGPPGERDTIDIAQGGQDVTIFGADSADELGFALAAGDVNGDGTDDILVGAPLADGPNNERPRTGEAYLIFGSPSLPETIDIALGQQDLTIFGAEEDDRLGSSLASGDANNDGIQDILLGAFLADGPQNARNEGGEAYLIHGSPSLAGSRDMALDQYDLAVIGAEEDDQLGYQVAMGDLNSDGIDDIVIDAFRADGPANAREDAGEVYVFFGSPSLTGLIDLATASPDVAILAADKEDDFGDVLTTGDVNGDGIDDLLLGVPRGDGPDNARNSAGEAYVFFGSPSLAGTLDTAQDPQDVTILGSDPRDRLGASLAAGDVNGDGIADIIVGAETADGPRNGREDAGEVYIVFGSPSLGRTVDIALADHNATIFGSRTEDVFGAAVALVDWNADGRGDVLAAARDAAGPDGAREDAGAAYVIPVGP